MPKIEFNNIYTKLFQSAEELNEPEQGVVTGTIPEWIKGSFIRVGPGKWDIGDFTMNHYLDGYALITKFEIDGENSVVKLQKRYLESDAYKKALANGRPVITEFGTKAFPEKKGFLSRLISSLSVFDMTDNATCSLFNSSNHSSEIFVTSNTTFFRKINPKDLSTEDVKYDYYKCFGLNGISVHPMEDSNGNQYNIGFSILPTLKYHIIKLKPNGRNYEKVQTTEDLIERSETICSIPSRWGTAIGYFHSFGMSKNYIIFIEMPFKISMTKAAKSLVKGDSFKDWLEWRGSGGDKDKEYCKFFIIDKSSGKIINQNYEYKSDKPFFFLHVINCYEDNDEIIIDINTYDSPTVLDSLYMKNLRTASEFPEKDPPTPQRFKIPLTLNETHLQRKGNQILVMGTPLINESGLELPVINKNYECKEYQYFYCTGTICKNYFRNSLCKVDVKNESEIQMWKENEYTFPGEPLFLSNPNRSQEHNSEDNGTIISACTNIQDRDFLIFLNAKDMTELGRATFCSDVPQAMHGIFLRSDCANY